MINKLFKIIIVLIILINNGSCKSSELKVNQCNFKIDKGNIIVELCIINNSNKVYFIPLLYWEIEIIKDGNHILNYPYEKYAVNRIYIYSNEFNSIKSTGSKCCFPEYKTLPIFSELKPDSLINITITISSKIKLIDTMKYKTEMFFCYYDENILESQVNNTEIPKSQFLIQNSNFTVQLDDGLNNIIKYKSDIKIMNNILIDKYFVLKALCE